VTGDESQEPSAIVMSRGVLDLILKNITPA